jgi:hypothetical protein
MSQNSAGLDILMGDNLLRIRMISFKHSLLVTTFQRHIHRPNSHHNICFGKIEMAAQKATLGVEPASRS